MTLCLWSFMAKTQVVVAESHFWAGHVTLQPGPCSVAVRRAQTRVIEAKFHCG